MKEAEKTWFTILISVDPTFSNQFFPEGIWQTWTRKYKSMRRAEQALPYIQQQVSSQWGTKIVPCVPPISQQDRIRLNIFST